MSQITFNAIDYDPSGKWNVQSQGFDIQGGGVWEIGATVTTYSWINRAILHIVNITNNEVIKSVMSEVVTTDFEASISIDCIYRPQDNVRVGIFLEGTGNTWFIVGNYGPSSTQNPNYNSTNLTYFWIHQIA